MKVASDLEPLLIDIESVEPWPGNYREGDIGAISESLKRFGQQKPIVVQKNSMRIVAGNHVWQGARALGAERIAANVEEMDDDTAEAFLLADNRTSERGTSNEERLAFLLERVAHRGLDGTGYDGEDVDDLLKRVRKQQVGVVKPEVPFSTELLEEHQYVVLYFDNTLDWNMAVTKLGIVSEKAPDSTETYQRIGIGRVIRGADVVKRLAD